MTIVFHDMGSAAWPAGKLVLELLIHGLRAQGKLCPRLLLSVWDNKNPSEYAAIANLFDGVVLLPGGGTDPRLINDILRQAGADVFFSLPTEFASKLSIPRVLWLYDFQHLHYPSNFPIEVRQRMDRLFHENAATANRILAYSQAVHDDIQTYLPAQAHKTHRIRFVPSIPDSAWTSDPSARLAQYRLPDRFFYVPNQLYPYKNHKLLVAALAHLKTRNINASVVCSGTTIPGQEAVLTELMAQAEQLNVANQLIMLGSVPRDTVFALMRQSLCVVNPSLFEGFGLSVAEARYLGQRVLLSDLPVMHEHQVINASYFDPLNSEDLATKMELIWNSANAIKPNDITAGAAAPYQQALQEFSSELIKLFSLT